jgi:GNAT superfamily N-acetyltransferase
VSPIMSVLQGHGCGPANSPGLIRQCTAGDFQGILEIVQEAAEAYRGAIPEDCWHEPYMPAEELTQELRRGVSFFGCEIDGELVGVMGWERVLNALLIRHAYVRRSLQGQGIGALLLNRLRGQHRQQWLVGTWADASWAVRFYEQNGFMLLEPSIAALFLKTYWDISSRQMDVSVVLARPHLTEAEAFTFAANAQCH